MYRVKQIEAGHDLAGFSRWLQEQGVVHRITEEGGAQILWLENAEHTEPVLRALERYLSEPELRQRVDEVATSPVFVGGRWQPSPRHAPFVLTMIIVAAVVALVTGLGQNWMADYLKIVDPLAYNFESVVDRVQAFSTTMSNGELWRIFSPDFLHFSWAHIVFNSVMLWFLGSQVEWFDGRQRLMTLFVTVSIVSNGFQYVVSGPNFGGLSGVVYGIIGYCWLSQRRGPRFQFPPALATFAIAWMILGYTSLPEYMHLGRMANEAHLGGFLAGLALAFILPVPKKAPQRGGA